MNETIIISKEYISREMFEKTIVINNYHCELAGNDDELWLIDDEKSKAIVRISLVNIVNGNYVYSDDPLLALEGVKSPYEGIYYFIEYNNPKIMSKVIGLLNSNSRDIYVLNEENTKFIRIKQLI